MTKKQSIQNDFNPPVIYNDALERFRHENPIDNDMSYKNPAYQQEKTLRTLFRLARGIFHGKEIQDCQLSVIGSHTSKSIKLPIVEYTFPNGANLVIRDNFHAYAISVTSPFGDVSADLIKDIDYYNGTKEIHSYECQGFPKEKIHGTYEDNPRQFTFQTIYPEQLSYFVLSFARQQKNLQCAPKSNPDTAPRKSR